MLLSFEQVLAQANKPKLLLGNGFSIALDPKRFSFTNLLDSAIEKGILKKNSPVFKVFELLQTADFESVMRALENTWGILDIYDPDNTLGDQIKKDNEDLKNHLVEIITNNHPLNSTDVPKEKKLACLEFLKNFDCIYTLNYDLLLYWAIMVEDENKKWGDGFWETEESSHEWFVVYRNSKGFELHFLHGALHIFDAWDEIIKKTYSKTGVDLVTQIRSNLENNIYPIFVSEWDSEQKMKKIIHNGYLNHCYRSIWSIWGDLVIFGSYLKKHDEHILDAIISSWVKNVFIGVSKEDSVPHIQTAIETYNARQKKPEKHKTLYLYDYTTINPWEYGLSKS